MTIKDWKKIRGNIYAFQKLTKNGIKEIGSYSEGRYGEKWVSITETGKREIIKIVKSSKEGDNFIKRYMRKN